MPTEKVISDALSKISRLLIAGDREEALIVFTALLVWLEWQEKDGMTKNGSVQMVPETAIRPIPNDLPDMPDKISAIRPAQPPAAGSHACLHTETVRAEYRAGNEERAYGFWHYAKPYKIKRFANDDTAYRWAVEHGYKYDGRLAAGRK